LFGPLSPTKIIGDCRTWIRAEGFIKTATEKDIFFHSKALQSVEFDDLREGPKVTYTVGHGPRGRAENVKVV
jgi:cold shock protein